MPSLSIRQKSLILFLSISLIPLMAINLFWVKADQNNLRTAAAEQQSLLATSAANRVGEYLSNTVNSLIIHSQTASVQKFDLPYAGQELSAFVNQDADIQRIALVDSGGQEKAAFDRQGTVEKLSNVASTDPFRVVTFLSGNEYISPVFYDQNTPHIIIAVPLVTLANSQNISSLSTSESGVIRGPNDIHGALITDVSLNNLWKSVLSTKLGSGGYTYLVDDKGFLIAYPDQSFIKNHADQSKNPEVSAFLATNQKDDGQPQQTKSEKNVAVLSTYSRVSRTNWAVIAEEPLSSIYSKVNHVSNLAVLIFWISGVITIIFSMLFSHQLSTPIQKLTEGAQRIGAGDLQFRFEFKGKNEISLLGHTFNNMASNLSQVIKGVEAGRSKLNVVLNTIDDGVLALDGQENILVINSAAAAMIGLPPNLVIGRKLGDTFKFTKNNNPIKIDYSQAEASYDQLQLISPDSQTRFVDLSAAPIKDDPTGIQTIITIHDETTNRELETMKVDFVSMAAHELRTPLTAIRGYLSLTKREDEALLNPKQRQYLDRARTSADQLAGLINNLLNVARIEKGTLSMNMDKLNWAELAETIVKDQTFSAQQKNISINYHDPGKELLILGDEVALSEVLNNLISNAIHYSPAGSRIDVNIYARDKDILTSVTDNGIGIPIDAQAHLFTKFFRVHGGLAMGSGGTGLGLYISKSIIDLHQGKIGVQSQPKQGSTFFFSLPYFDPGRYDKLSHQSKLMRNKRGWITKNIAR